MNIHFSFRLQKGGVTEIPISIKGITFSMQTLEHEPLGLHISTVCEFIRCALVTHVTWTLYYGYISLAHLSVTCGADECVKSCDLI